MKAKIGDFLLPAFTSITDILSTRVLPTLETFVEAFRVGGFSGLFEELGKKWEAALPGIDSFIQALPGRVTQYLNENLPDYLIKFRAPGENKVAIDSEGADFLSESIDDALSILEEISEDVTMEIKNRS